jgi:oligoendopeptidase F
VCVAGAVSAQAGGLPVYKPDATAARASVPDVYKWNLAPLFASDEAWERAGVELHADVAKLAAYKGALGDPAKLADCLELYFKLHRTANFLTLYANLRQSTAASDDQAGAMVQKSLAEMDEVMAAAAFIRRELLALPAAPLAAALGTPRLAFYRAYVDNLRRRSSRVLSEDGERAVSLLGDNLWAEIDLNEIPSSLEDAYGAALADIPWPKVKDEQGHDVQLTLSNFARFRRSLDRDVRRGATEALYGTLRQYQHLFAATLGGQVKLDVAYARARGYDTALAAYLDKDNIPTAVYDTLISTVGANLPLLHRYMELRKRALGLPSLHGYDLAIPLVPGVAVDIPYQKARATIIEALRPLGAEYGRVLAGGLDPANGWLDLYPHKDKRSGAFSSSVFGVHPYVFMNYQDALVDMSTLAHEYGHALHSDLAMRAQPYANFRYVPFLAEIASTCNEALLSDYLAATAPDSAQKAYVLAGALERIRGTILRQTMFAEFERSIHRSVEAGTPLTASLLEKTYADLVRRYHGPAYTLDPNDGLEWAQVPHFYYKYYVFVYATGMASGIAIADRVREQGQPAVDAYLGMLKGGCAAPPLDLLKGAGVDLTRPDAIEAAMRTFKRTLDEVERLLAR